VCVRVRVCVCVCVCVCVRERERGVNVRDCACVSERVRKLVCVSVNVLKCMWLCACVWERSRVCVWVCVGGNLVCQDWKEREKCSSLLFNWTNSNQRSELLLVTHSGKGSNFKQVQFVLSSFLRLPISQYWSFAPSCFHCLYLEVLLFIPIFCLIHS